LHVLKHFDKDRFDTAAKRQCLFCVCLRQEKSELISADAESRIGSAKSLFEGGRSGAKNFIAAGMAMLIVHFLEAMQVENYQA
jgi:hypothetical protein